MCLVNIWKCSSCNLSDIIEYLSFIRINSYLVLCINTQNLYKADRKIWWKMSQASTYSEKVWVIIGGWQCILYNTHVQVSKVSKFFICFHGYKVIVALSFCDFLCKNITIPSKKLSNKVCHWYHVRGTALEEDVGHWEKKSLDFILVKIKEEINPFLISDLLERSEFWI